jgi:transposase
MPPAALARRSPYDPEARRAIKRTTEWTGYMVHLTETCDDDAPHLITDVATVPATTRDVEMTAAIQAALAERDLAPAEHLADAGYVSGRLLASSRADHGIELVGPAPQDCSWQARAGAGFDMPSFQIDWAGRTATCPRGKRSRYWSDSKDVYGHPINQIVFDKADCLACPSRPQCTVSKAGPRVIALLPRDAHLALQAARQREGGEEFKAAYAKRAGVEGTISQGTRACGLRRARYAGLGKVRLQHLATAAGINLHRLDDWWAGTPRARTRRSAFARLAAA